MESKKVILFIDDETLLTDLAHAYFEDENLYELVTFNDAQAALDYFTKNNQIIHVVICDRCLGGDYGDKLIKNFHKINQDVLYFIATGSIANVSNYPEIEHIITDVLCKPFSFHELHDRIKGLLN